MMKKGRKMRKGYTGSAKFVKMKGKNHRATKQRLK